MPASGAPAPLPTCVHGLMPWEFPAEFAAAARAGDTQRVRALCKLGPDFMNSRDDDHNAFTPLCWAAWEGHKDIVAVLLEAGANPNLKDRDGQTALFNAAWHGHTACVETLLNAGADSSIADKDKDTPLLVAAREGHYAVSQRLAMAGADPRYRDPEGKTARMWAIDGGHDALAQGLLVYESRWDELQEQRRIEAERRRQEEERKRAEVARRYAEWVERRTREAHAERAFTASDEARIRQYILEDERSQRRAWHAECDMARSRAAFKTQARLMNEEEDIARTSLCSTEQQARDGILKRKELESWAPLAQPVSLHQSRRSSGLSTATQPERYSSTRTSAASSLGPSDFDETSVEDQLAKIIWETQGQLGKVEQARLNEIAEAVSRRSFAGPKAGKAAKEVEPVAACGTLQDLCEAARDGDEQRCQSLVAGGVPVEQSLRETVQTPLMWACVGGHLNVVKWLIGAGACPRRQDKCGYSAPFHAIHHGHFAVLQYLCQTDADPRQVDSEKHGLVHWAGFAGNLEILDFLLCEMQLPPDGRDVDGRTPLHWAARQGHAQVAERLARACPSLRNIADNKGKTASDHAMEGLHREISRSIGAIVDGAHRTRELA